MTAITSTTGGHGLQHNSNKGSNLLKNYARMPVSFEKGNGVYLYDRQAKAYLDFLCGISVTSFGHNHPQITEAVQKQVAAYWHVSNLYEIPLQESVASALTKASTLDYVFFCNSGTEANEAAIKFARKFGNSRTTIITTENSFHGRTYGSMSASGQKKIHDGFAPLCPGFCCVPFNTIDAIKEACDEQTIAVLLEPIQGEYGIVIPSENYLKQVRAFCDQHDLLLIIDEVQAGMGRTGKMFAHQWYGIKPDIVTCAKAIANGLPLGAVLCTKAVADAITFGSHGATFGGNPVALAAAQTVLELIDKKTLDHVAAMGDMLFQSITKIGSASIKEVRGKGLMIGIEFHDSVNAKEIQRSFLEHFVLVGVCGDHVIRILPPFIVQPEEVKRFIHIFQKILEKETS